MKKDPAVQNPTTDETCLLDDETLTCVAGGGIERSPSDLSAAGLAAWAQTAYMEGWSYVWGGSTPGSVDCSGLIYSYAHTNRETESMFACAPERGPIASIPEIPGIGVYAPGHVGVYIGRGMVIDARNEHEGICCAPISAIPWTHWFRVRGVYYLTEFVTVPRIPFPEHSGR